MENKVRYLIFGKAKRQKGSAMIESSLFIIMVGFVFVFIFDFALLGYNWLSLEAVVNTGIRAGVLSDTPEATAVQKACEAAKVFKIDNVSCQGENNNGLVQYQTVLTDQSDEIYDHIGKWLLLRAEKKYAWNPLIKEVMKSITGSYTLILKTQKEGRIENETI